MRAAWWWIDRWRKSTAYTDMNGEEQGIYRNLLDELWLRDGLLPLDDDVLAKIGGDPKAWPRVARVVLARFRRTPKGYRNGTHDEIQHESKRLAMKQKRYRDRRRRGNVTGDVTGDVIRSPSPSLTDIGVIDRQESSTTHREPEANNSPTLPPSDSTERAIRRKTDALRDELYGLIDVMARRDPERRDATELMQLVTGYNRKNGTKVHGVVNAAMLSFERLEKSIRDAKAHLQLWAGEKL